MKRHFLVLCSLLFTSAPREMRSITKTASSVLVLIILLFKVHGRSLQNQSSGLVSDGTDDVQSHEPSFLLLKGMGSSDECEHMYGFLPCSSNIYGHLFLIVVYEYLLFRGESLMVAGGEQIFKLLGPGIFGASAFHILGALPESLIVLGILCLTQSSRFSSNFLCNIAHIAAY